MPHLNLPGSGFFCFANKPDYNVIAGADVCMVQRCCTAQQFEFLNTVRKLGQKLIYDLDDNVWELPDYNPAQKMLSQYRDGFIYCIRMVDLVTVSTYALAKAVRRHVRVMVNKDGKEIPILVVENRMDTRLFAQPVKAKEMIVGWAGSSSHIGDFPVMGLEDIVDYYPDVTFEFRGCEPPDSLLNKPNVRHRVWMPVAEYCSRMPLWGWSIALAPVTEHDFNNSKSCIKMVEAAWCKLPCLASWVRPYEEFCSHDSELRWLLCAGRSSWGLKLKELIHDSARREYLGERAYRVAMDYYSWDKPHEGWQKILDMVKVL